MRLTGGYAVLYEGRWVTPEWIDVTETEEPNFNPQGFVPAIVEGVLRLFLSSDVAAINPETTLPQEPGE